ncbi:organic cation transporter protein-like [Babylonia areolata]|uniref:organic cation transporter protein-like n=1 Tax=Babylonia areolata TaxID=304850 RepID=UPI003FCF1C9D
MNVDEILRRVGEFGMYQKMIYLLLNLIGVTHGFRMLIAVFMLYTPKHRCSIPTYPNDTYKIQSQEHADLVARFIPNKTDDHDLGPYDLCHVYSGAGARNATVGCDRWVYDKSMFVNTAVMEFDAVCDDALLSSHSQMSQMGGFLFGVLFFGAIGDKFGRKVAIYLAVVVYLAGGLGLSWSPLIGYGFFVFLRFVNGACSAGAYTAACVLSVEMVGPNKRLWVGVLIHLTFGVGGMVLDLIGYFQRDWFFINIYGTAPVALALSFWWIIPESPRWLAKQGRVKEAEAILRKVAKFNGKTFPDCLLADPAPPPAGPASQRDNTRLVNQGPAKTANDDRGSLTTASQKDTVVKEKTESDAGVTNGVSSRAVYKNVHNQGILREFLRMFTYRVLLVRNVVQFINWFAVSMAYYGLSFTANQLQAGGLFTNFLLSMCMDVLANVLVLLLLDRWGRRLLHALSMLLGGAGCLLGVLTTMVAPSGLQWLTVVVAMVGKMGASAGFTLIYIYSSELCPTTVRSAGMGTASAFARLGSILASYVQQWSIQMTGDFGHALPLLVFGAFSLTAGMLTFLLPETLHKDLPDTVHDALVFGKDPKMDEHIDPVKTVETFSMGEDVHVEMETFKTPTRL